MSQAAPKVVVSIKPVHSLVAAVMDGVGEPYLLIEGSTSPHDYALRPSDARQINQADIIFFVSNHLETSVASATQHVSQNVNVIELSKKDGIILFPFQHNHLEEPDHHGRSHKSPNFDPHIWLHPENAIDMVDAIEEALSKADPMNMVNYKMNAKHITTRIQNTSEALRLRLQRVNEEPYIVFHDAYQYFERYFTMHSLGAIRLSDTQSPSVKRIKEIHNMIDQQDVKCMFTEPQFSPTLIENIAKDIDVKIGVLDPLGIKVPAGKDAYITILQNVADNLIMCLKDE